VSAGLEMGNVGGKEGEYFARASFCEAWWVDEGGVLGLGSGRGVEVYDPLWRWWRICWRFLCHVDL